VARLLGKRTTPKLYTVGIEGSYDLRIGKETAEFLGLPWEGIVVDERDLVEAILEICQVIPTRNPVTISFEMPLYLVASNVNQRYIFSGQGADELFAGYARYKEMEGGELEQTMNNDLAQLLEKGLDYERQIASSHQKELHYLYLHEEVVDCVRSIPISEEFRGDERKAVLRDVARLLDMGDIADRKKKAAQYGSGIMKTLRKIAKQNGMTVRSFIRVLVHKGEMP
jgi:asparagine synthase (glutamine-hydrolysing)